MSRVNRLMNVLWHIPSRRPYEKMDPNNENFIIGGASIYRQFLKHANKLYITWVHEEFVADTFFPELDENEWNIISKEDFPNPDEKNPYPYSYVIYERK